MSPLPKKLLLLKVFLVACTCTADREAARVKNTVLDASNLAYCGCLLFVDDAKSFSDFKHMKDLPFSNLVRSWYRWGEPQPDKAYSLRKGFVKELHGNGVGIGGGGSISVLNERDVKSSSFKKSWLARDLDGTQFRDEDKIYGSISNPEFRQYVISKALEQVRLGIAELHFGESHGSIHFDDYTLGLEGNNGFVQWIEKKYRHKDLSWWERYLGNLGRKIATKKAIVRSDFLHITGLQKKNFRKEWGEEASWNGENENDQPAFLAFKYAQNMSAFLQELRQALVNDGYSHVKIDIWGFGNWMSDLTSKPDAFMSTPPGYRWGINWATDQSGDFELYEQRIKGIMESDIRKFAPIPVVYMIDHPRPFHTDFINLSDERQSYITEKLARLSWSVGANFIFRSYSQNLDRLGSKTKKTIEKLCQEATKRKICPKVEGM